MKKQMQTSSKKDGRRSRTGSNIVEGTVAIMVTMLGIIMAILLVANFAATVFYKQKIGFITTQAARMAVEEYGGGAWNWSFNRRLTNGRLERKVESRVNDMLAAVGLPRAQAIEVRPEVEGVAVRVTVRGLSLVGNGSILPAHVDFDETAFVSFEDNQPPALCTFVVDDGTGLQKQVVVPSYGKFISPFSNGNTTDLSKAPQGTAVFRNFQRQYAQFSVDLGAGSSVCETLVTSNDPDAPRF
jgi:hypothetical protein